MTQVSRKGFRDKNGKQVVIVPKVPGATAGNFVSIDAEGNLQDSGLAAGDVITNIAVEDLSELDDIISTGVYHVVVYNESGITQTREAKILFVRGSLSMGVYRLTQYLFDRYSIMSRTKAATSPEWNEWEETNIGNVLTEPDDTPTEDSNKLVTSGGVKAELNKISELIRSIGNTSIDEMPIIKIGEGAVSEGYITGAVRDYAHAEGLGTVAAGTASHAEGYGGYDDRETIDVTKFWVVRNPNIDGAIDYCKIVVNCAQGYTPDMFVSAGDIILYHDESTFEYKYASVIGVGWLPGTVEYYLQLSSSIKVNVTDNSLSKTLYKIPSGAFGKASHVEGRGTIAKADYQHVQGKYNVVDANGDYAFIIGNGTDNMHRNNAFGIKWNGDVVGDSIKSTIPVRGDGDKLPNIAALRAAISALRNFIPEFQITGILPASSSSYFDDGSRMDWSAEDELAFELQTKESVKVRFGATALATGDTLIGTVYFEKTLTRNAHVVVDFEEEFATAAESQYPSATVDHYEQFYCHVYRETTANDDSVFLINGYTTANS